MSPTVGDLHAGPAGERGERFARETLEGLERLEVRAVVIGGTALRVYGSPVASIDLDVLVHEADWDRPEVHDFIEARSDEHRAAHADAYLEVHALEWPRRVWSSNAAYLPLDVLRPDGTRRIATAIDGRRLEVEVPNPAELAFMKAKAFGDRAAQYAALRDPVWFARLADEDREPIEGVAPAFYLRKASKDLVDIAFLERHGATPAKIHAIAEALGLAEVLQRSWDEVSADVVQEALAIARRHELGLDPTRSVAALQAGFAGAKSR